MTTPTNNDETTGGRAARPAPTDGQVQLVAELRVEPGAEARARDALDRLVGATHREDDGCVSFEVGVDPSDDTRYVGYEVWESQAALDRHAAKAHTRRFLEEARGFAANPDEPLSFTRWSPLTPLQARPYRAAGEGGTGRAPAPAPAGFSHGYADLDGVRLHYVSGGTGEPVVLLHGFPSTWYAWREVMPALAERHTVVAVDLRGMGDSGRPGGGYDVPTTSEDVHRLVEHLGLGPVFLAGQDWGGSTAYAYAAAHPEGVRALAVLEAMPSGPWTERSGGGEAWFAAFHRIPDLPETLVAGREREYLGWFYRAFSATPGVPNPEAVEEYLRTYEAPGAMTAAFGRYRGASKEIRHNAEHSRGPLPVPVLAVGGERVFGGAVAENLRHGAASDVRGEVLEGCGHYLTEERPEELSRLLLGFFGEGLR